jgi:hypothetical protein
MNMHFKPAQTNFRSTASINAGRYESAALPMFRGVKLNATLDPGLDHSFLSTDQLTVFQGTGAVRLSFALLDELTGQRRVHTSQLESVEDIVLGDGVQVRCYLIHTLIILGYELFEIALRVVDLPLRSTHLVVGQDLIGDRFAVDETTAFALGEPQHPAVALFQQLSYN